MTLIQFDIVIIVKIFHPPKLKMIAKIFFYNRAASKILSTELHK